MALVAHERVHEQLEPQCKRERLVRLLAAERNQLLLLGQAVAQDSKWAEYAAKDSDFDSIRAEQGFPS